MGAPYIRLPRQQVPPPPWAALSAPWRCVHEPPAASPASSTAPDWSGQATLCKYVEKGEVHFMWSVAVAQACIPSSWSYFTAIPKSSCHNQVHTTTRAHHADTQGTVLVNYGKSDGTATPHVPPWFHQHGRQEQLASRHCCAGDCHPIIEMQVRMRTR